MSNETEDECFYAPQIYLEWKMWFVGVIGFSTALVSIVHNCLLFYTFNSSKGYSLVYDNNNIKAKASVAGGLRVVNMLYGYLRFQLLRRRNLTYLMWISLCDIFISLSYIAIMCVQVYFDYFESFSLYVLWHRYLLVAFTVSHITISSATFLLMAATIERYLQTTGNVRSTAIFYFLSNHRGSVVFLCFLAGVIFRGTVCMEIEIVHQEECDGFASYFATVSNITDNPLFDVIWKFWVRKIASVFLPFLVMAYFNAAIVVSVRQTDRDQTVKTLILYVTVGSKGEVARLRSRLRTVTRMLVMVVCCYLCANVLDVTIAAWEVINPASLTAFDGVYTVTTDISSFLPILACALRLPIYTVNDREIRMEVLSTIDSLVTQLCGCLPCCRFIFGRRGKLCNKPLESNYSSVPHKVSRLETRFGMSGLIMIRATLADEDDGPLSPPPQIFV